MAWRADPAQATGAAPPVTAVSMILFFGFYAFMVGVLGLWSRLLARRVQGTSLRRRVRFLDSILLAARFVVLIWFGIGVFFLGWGDVVARLMGPLNYWPLQFPSTLI